MLGESRAPCLSAYAVRAREGTSQLRIRYRSIMRGKRGRYIGKASNILFGIRLDPIFKVAQSHGTRHEEHSHDKRLG